MCPKKTSSLIRSTMNVREITRQCITWVLKLTSQLWLVPGPLLLSSGRIDRRIQQGIENRGFNQVKNFFDGIDRRIQLGIENRGFNQNQKRFAQMAHCQCHCRGQLKIRDNNK